MKKKHLLAILFFGGLWGLSEAVLGDALYSAGVTFASVPLTVIGFFILAVASRFVPHRGASTAIASLAMLFKFLNVPFFACHLAGIFIQGLSFDLVFAWRSKGMLSGTYWNLEGRRSFVSNGLKAALACYLSRALFCFVMIFIFQYEYWLKQGPKGVWEHIGEGGTVAGIGCALAVTLGFVLGRRLVDRLSSPKTFPLQPRLATALATIVTAGVWVYGLATKLWGKG